MDFAPLAAGLELWVSPLEVRAELLCLEAPGSHAVVRPWSRSCHSRERTRPPRSRTVRPTARRAAAPRRCPWALLASVGRRRRTRRRPILCAISTRRACALEQAALPAVPPAVRAASSRAILARLRPARRRQRANRRPRKLSCRRRRRCRRRSHLLPPPPTTVLVRQLNDQVAPFY